MLYSYLYGKFIFRPKGLFFTPNVIYIIYIYIRFARLYVTKHQKITYHPLISVYIVEGILEHTSHLVVRAGCIDSLA